MIRSIHITLVLFLASTSAVEASTCVKDTGTPNGALSMSNRSEIVLLGRVVERATQLKWQDGKSRSSTTLTVEPIEMFKGQSDTGQLLFTPGPYSQFVVGNIYLVFAYRYSHIQDALIIDSCNSLVAELDPAGDGSQNLALRDQLAPILEALRRTRDNID